MKKAVAILLVLILTLSTLMIPVSASDLDRTDPQGYYIIGTMNDWQVCEDYRIISPDERDKQTYRFPLYMTPEDSFKIVYSSDGVTPDAEKVYPAGEGAAFNQESPIIKESGTYVFAFRPACDGGRGYIDDGLIYHASEREVWYYDCIICEGYQPANNCYLHGDEPATEPGYYIVGTMNDWKPKKYYQVINPYGLYQSAYPITLRRGDIFKIAYSEDGENITRLYPEGEGNAYNEDVTRIYYDGQEMIVNFFPNGDANEEEYYDYSGKGIHYGMISVYDCSMWDCLEPLEIPAKPHTGGVYRDAFTAAYPDIDEAYLDYEELYIHRDKSGDPDWVLVWASNYQYEGSSIFSVVGNRAYNQSFYKGNPFLTHYGVYDVKKDRFYDPGYGARSFYDSENIYHEGFIAENYADFDRVIDQYATLDYNSNGRLLGDLDRDDEITIVDATILQRCEAKNREWPQDDAISLNSYVKKYTTVPGYYSDFNRDGERDITDATCIQRYLAGQTYPIG